MSKKRRKVKKKPLAQLIVIVLVILFGYILINKMFGKNKTEKRFLGNSVPEITLKDKENKESKTVYRGKEVDYYINEDNENIAKIKIDGEIFYVDKKFLVNDKKDTVQEKEMYVRTSYNINKDLDSVDLFSFSTHKFYGPKGVGCLIKKNNISK